MTETEIVEILGAHGFTLRVSKKINHGVQLVFTNGAMVSVYHRTGSINIQGKHTGAVNEILCPPAPTPAPVPTPDWQPVAAHDDADDIF